MSKPITRVPYAMQRALPPKGKHDGACDQCGKQYRTVRGTLSRIEIYETARIVLRWCSPECQAEWDAEDADSEPSIGLIGALGNYEGMR